MKRRDVLKAGFAMAGASLLPASVNARARLPTALVVGDLHAGASNFPALILRRIFLPEVIRTDDAQAALKLAARRMSLIVVDLPHIATPDQVGKAWTWKRRLRETDPDAPLLFTHGYEADAYPAALFEGAHLLPIPYRIQDLIAECSAFGIERLPRDRWVDVSQEDL